MIQNWYLAGYWSLVLEDISRFPPSPALHRPVSSGALLIVLIFSHLSFHSVYFWPDSSQVVTCRETRFRFSHMFPSAIAGALAVAGLAFPHLPFCMHARLPCTQDRSHSTVEISSKSSGCAPPAISILCGSVSRLRAKEIKTRKSRRKIRVFPTPVIKRGKKNTWVRR